MYLSPVLSSPYHIDVRSSVDEWLVRVWSVISIASLYILVVVGVFIREAVRWLSSRFFRPLLLVSSIVRSDISNTLI
jgi:hypothetical protein